MPTLNDFAKINERVVDENTVLPQDIKFATNRNRERDSINAGVFEQHCQESASANAGIAADSMMIFSDNIFIKGGVHHKRPLQD